MKLELRGITKRFPGVIANEGVDLTVEPGQIHALLGENGAGKTTLMNVLYGLYKQDEGEILIDGSPVVFHDPGDAIRAGIGMVHQHFMLVPVFTVTENVMLGVESTRGPLRIIDKRTATARILEISARHNLHVDPDALVEDLPVGVRQRVEIIKTLYRQSNLLILDEPSAVLTPQETDELFEIMRSLQASGTSIIFITHKLNEVLEIADRITVLRRGKVVGSATPAEATQQSLAQMMVGRPVDLEVDKTPGDARRAGARDRRPVRAATTAATGGPRPGPRRARGRDRGDRRRAGERPDRAGRGDHRAASPLPAARSGSPATR